MLGPQSTSWVSKGEQEVAAPRTDQRMSYNLTVSFLTVFLPQ